MIALDFNAEPNELLDYVVARVYESESGDERAASYLEWLWDEDPDLLEDAFDIYREETGQYDAGI